MSNAKLFFIIILLTQLSGCNFFQDLGDNSSKEARIEEAKIQIDRGNYTAAMDILDNLVVEYPADSEVATLRSSAYAGAAGIGLMDIGFNIGSMLTSANPIDKPFEAYLAFVENPGTTEKNYAIAARDSLLGFSSNPATRTNEMNMYLTIMSYGLIGAILSASSDTTPNDNKADTAFDCASLSDDDTKEVILTYAVAKQSAAVATGESLWAGIKTQVTTFTSALQTAGLDLSITSKSQVTTLQCSAMKSLLVGGLLGSVKVCICS